MAEKIKTSFIATVLNEEETIIELLDSVLVQSILPNEVVLVDGGSSDRTLTISKSYLSKFNKKNIDYKIFVKKGNRSVGRNHAIKNSKGQIIICSDAGNILDKKWTEEIINPLQDKSVDVVSGYYKGLSQNVFQKSVVPYVLVMENSIGSNFLPSTRSMAMRKTVWKEMGGFPEQFSNNEDYVFSNAIQKKGYKIFFNKNAIVYWLPRKSLSEFFRMIFSFAYGDSLAGILRPKVALIFLRYAIGLVLLFLAIMNESRMVLIILLFMLFLYLIWAVSKNYQYVKSYQAVLILPTLQITSDVAVILGTLLGFNRWAIKKTQ